MGGAEFSASAHTPLSFIKKATSYGVGRYSYSCASINSRISAWGGFSF